MGIWLLAHLMKSQVESVVTESNHGLTMASWAGSNLSAEDMLPSTELSSTVCRPFSTQENRPAKFGPRQARYSAQNAGGCFSPLVVIAYSDFNCLR
jgi:hypothetical protein